MRELSNIYRVDTRCLLLTITTALSTTATSPQPQRITNIAPSTVRDKVLKMSRLNSSYHAAQSRPMRLYMAFFNRQDLWTDVVASDNDECV
jgi:hypothetical protein